MYIFSYRYMVNINKYKYIHMDKYYSKSKFWRGISTLN